ncbi:hypothetical protein EYC84_003522 [Monilinia fructicola]|uniref:Uncharacterized protein n=1 Tax=Monilinia fructicola TaxID=38448 RepID=A0A5M9JWE3_MONFR|nr:hypothetical protein EYC84_003522 [Monilinia fructicola]
MKNSNTTANKKGSSRIHTYMHTSVQTRSAENRARASRIQDAEFEIPALHTHAQISSTNPNKQEHPARSQTKTTTPRDPSPQTPIPNPDSKLIYRPRTGTYLAASNHHLAPIRCRGCTLLVPVLVQPAANSQQPTANSQQPTANSELWNV